MDQSQLLLYQMKSQVLLGRSSSVPAFIFCLLLGSFSWVINTQWESKITSLFNSYRGTTNANLQWWQKPRRSQNKQRIYTARHQEPSEASKDSALLRSLLLPLLLWCRELFPQSGLHLCSLWTPSTLTTAGIVPIHFWRRLLFKRIIFSSGSILDYHICSRILGWAFLRYLHEVAFWIIRYS